MDHIGRFLIISIFLSSISVQGQSASELTFKSWQKNDGLPSNNINSITKDKLGFLWVATTDGLCRYDGPNSFKVFRKSNDKSTRDNTLESDNIRALTCDSKGNLWIGTRFGGLTKFNPLTNEWKTYRNDINNANSLSHDEVLTILEDSKNRIWIGTEDGLNLYNESSESFTVFRCNRKDGPSPNAKAILTIMEDDKGWIWVGTWSGGMHLLMTDEKGELSPNLIKNIKLSKDKIADNVWELYQDKDGRYWAGTHGGGLFLMNLPAEASNQATQQNWKPQFFGFSIDEKHKSNLISDAIQTILHDQSGTLWIGTVHGLFNLSPQSLKNIDSKNFSNIDFQVYLSSNSDLSGSNIIDMYEDDQGLIWFGTEGGLNLFNRYSNQFKNLFLPNDQREIDIPYASTIYRDALGAIWIGGGSSGLLKYQLENDQLIPQNHDLDQLIIGDFVSTIFSPDGNILLVGTELGISVVDMSTRTSKTYPTPDWVHKNYKNLFINHILVDSDGDIWFGTKVGLFHIHPETKHFSLYEPDAHHSNAISDYSITHMIEDNNGDIWVSTYNGLNKMEKLSNGQLRFTNYFFDKNHFDRGPLSNEVIHLKEAGNRLFIGTTSGLAAYNYDTQKFEAYNTKNRKFWIRSIEQTTDENLWVSTSEGLFYFDTKQNSYRTFDRQDGVIDNGGYRAASSYTDNDNRIYFAFTKGITHFHPDQLIFNEKEPPIFITEIERMSPQETEVVNGIYNDKIELEHDDYRVSINYTALNYNRGDKNQYAYKLEGFEEEWQSLKFGVPIVFTNLDPGEYSLRIKASNNDGVWNQIGGSISIVKHPAFWETWWFILIISEVLGLSAYMVLRWYIKKIRKHNEALQAFNKNLSEEISNRIKAESQLQEYNDELQRSNRDLEQFAYAASHDLQEPLRTVRNFSGLLAKKHSKNLDESGLEYIKFIDNSVKRMSNLVNSLLTYSIVGRKECVYEEIDLNELLTGIVEDLAQFIADKNVNVDIGKLPSIIGEKSQVGMVFFNLINNAIKFNNKKQPIVTIMEEKAEEEDFWKFSIKDNGIGIHPEYQSKIFGIFKRLHTKEEYDGTGIGLSVCKKIILRHGGKIWLESKPNEGTTFFFTISKNLQYQNEDSDSSENMVEIIEYA